MSVVTEDSVSLDITTVLLADDIRGREANRHFR